MFFRACLREKSVFSVKRKGPYDVGGPRTSSRPSLTMSRKCEWFRFTTGSPGISFERVFFLDLKQMTAMRSVNAARRTKVPDGSPSNAVRAIIFASCHLESFRGAKLWRITRYGSIMFL